MMTRPPRCSSPLRTGHNKECISNGEIRVEYVTERVRFRLLGATFYSITFNKERDRHSWATHIFACAFRLRYAVGVE